MESEYATAFSVLCGERVPDAGPEPDLVRIGIGGTADTAFCSILQWRKEREAEGLLKLSHSFMQKTEHPELELLVKVLNINLDKNLEILETCQLLKEYMLLVHKIRRYAIEYKDINQAAEKECIDENILAEFLRKNRAEAIEVCIFEYDEKRETELIRKAEFAEGEKVGEAKILLNLIEKGILTKEQALEQFGGTYEDLEKAALSVTLV